MSDSPPPSRTSPSVAILMGSKSDWPTMKLAAEILAKLGVPCESRVISAHRKPARLVEYINEAQSRGVQVFIAGAGGAAHLAGVIAAHTTRPVLGVPIKTSMSGGLDSLLSTVQMPRGIPVGTLATGEAGATNAGILAAQILGTSDETIAANVAAQRKAQAESLSESPE